MQNLLVEPVEPGALLWGSLLETALPLTQPLHVRARFSWKQNPVRPLLDYPPQNFLLPTLRKQFNLQVCLSIHPTPPHSLNLQPTELPERSLVSAPHSTMCSSQFLMPPWLCTLPTTCHHLLWTAVDSSATTPTPNPGDINSREGNHTLSIHLHFTRPWCTVLVQ